MIVMIFRLSKNISYINIQAKLFVNFPFEAFLQTLSILNLSSGKLPVTGQFFIRAAASKENPVVFDYYRRGNGFHIVQSLLLDGCQSFILHVNHIFCESECNRKGFRGGAGRK